MHVLGFQADPGKARGCSTNTYVIISLIDSLTHPLVKIPLRHRHALMVEDGAFCHKTDYVPYLNPNLNLKGHLNCFIGSKVTAILVNGKILPRGGVASGRVCPAACAAGMFLLKRGPRLTSA